jgi:hypothetical protein
MFYFKREKNFHAESQQNSDNSSKLNFLLKHDFSLIQTKALKLFPHHETVDSK